MLDLFAIANSNATAIEVKFEAVVTNLSPEQAALVRKFASWVEARALISINAQLYVIRNILDGEAHQNTYEFAEERASLGGRSAEDILHERLQDNYKRRVGFDRAFTDGEKFRYGAMHAGGTGLTDYGPYCMVLTRRFQESLNQIAYLPGDSLEICLRADASLDEAALKRSVAPHTHRHLMVAAECSAEIAPYDQRGWPRLLASEDRYFEVIFIGEVGINAVECVYVQKAEYNMRWESAFESFGAKLDTASRALVDDFVHLRRGVVEGKLRLEAVT
jgi:Holliday junction resolvase